MAAYPMCEAHRDAMASGEINFGIRLFKRVNDLSVTDEDLAQGFSSNSGQLVGYVTWATLESTKLPKWQLPPGHRDFNVSEIPSYINGQAGRAHAESFGNAKKLIASYLLSGYWHLQSPSQPRIGWVRFRQFSAFILCVGPSLMETLRGSKGKS
jgi:hypothetical protein